MLAFDEFLKQTEEKPKYTGRRLVMIDSKATRKSIAAHTKNAALSLASSSDFKEKFEDYHKAFDDADGIVFEEFGIAVVNEGSEGKVSMLTESSRSKNVFTYSEPERYVHALTDNYDEFMRGYKAAVDNLYHRLPFHRETLQAQKAGKNAISDNAAATWGIQAINAVQSPFSGKGVNIAVLDTGFNLKHPDFAGRVINTKSFIKGQKVDDHQGHGTHCTGISAGAVHKATSVRYGVARDANIFSGKVLNNKGEGTDSGILAGMEWAITSGCKVISMSLGAKAAAGDPFSNIYNGIAKKAMAKGVIIIAAAGNESKRSLGIIAPVVHPANCPSIMAVAALDNLLNVADFSCGGTDNTGGQVDIAAPGVDIFSAWAAAENYNTISGTSMATPYVAGIAALFWEANPNASASDIWMFLTQHAKRLNLNTSDVGAGLVQAPI